MNYEIVEMEPFSGRETKVYSIIPEGEEQMLNDDGDLYWSTDGTELEGNLKNYDNE